MQSDWDLNENVGQWLTRRLREVYNILSPSEKLSHETKEPLNETAWLAEISGVNIATIYRLKKSEDYYISRDSIREKLAHRNHTELLGYYGIPPLSHEDLKKTELPSSYKELIDKTFEQVISSLKPKYTTCYVCEQGPNHFVELNSRPNFCPETQKAYKTNAKIISMEYNIIDSFLPSPDNDWENHKGSKDIFIFYLTSHNLHYFGSISNTLKEKLFEVRIQICRDCLSQHGEVFKMPLSYLVRNILNENEISKIELAEEIKTHKSTIDRIIKNKISFVDPALTRKIFSFYFHGTTSKNKSKSRKVYEKSIKHLVNLTINRITLEQLNEKLILKNEGVIKIVESIVEKYKKARTVNANEVVIEETEFDNDKIKLKLKAFYYVIKYSIRAPTSNEYEYIPNNKILSYYSMSIDFNITYCDIVNDVTYNLISASTPCILRSKVKASRSNDALYEDELDETF